MARRWSAALLLLLAPPPVAGIPPPVPNEPLHHIFAEAFTPEECAELVRAFDAMPREVDERSIELLPAMRDDGFGVSRINRFDAEHALERAGKFDIVHDRLLHLAWPLLLPNASDADAPTRRRIFASLVDFHLLHEFQPGGHFDWHVDTKPRDGSSRTVNVNVLLSLPGSSEDFEGGALEVGGQIVTASQGDMYVYSAATPHRVRPLTRGQRYTLVIALTEERYEAAADGSGAGRESRREAYWRQTEANLAYLADGPLADEPKVHIIRGEFLEAAGRADEAQLAFCASYRATPEAEEHATSFFGKGTAALQGQPDLRLAENYLAMSECIAPGLTAAADALKVVREALAMVAARAVEGASQGADGVPDAKEEL